MEIVKLNLYLLVLLPARPPPDFSPTFHLVKESTLFFFCFLILGKHPPFRWILEADFVAESTNQQTKPCTFQTLHLFSDLLAIGCFFKIHQDFSSTLPKCSSSSLRSWNSGSLRFLTKQQQVIVGSYSWIPCLVWWFISPQIFVSVACVGWLVNRLRFENFTC